MSKQTLTEIFAEIGNHTGKDLGGNDKGSIHTYLETYDRLFEPFRSGCTMLEIGLASGDSLKLWDRYFENSIIFGVDLAIVFERPQYRNIVTLIEADATTPKFDFTVRNNHFDIIIDDASHMEADQIKTFGLLKGNMNPGGVYVIEDILAIDQNKEKFKALHPNCEVIDMRATNGRFDNVLIIYSF